ncbi:hypothetical protein CsSME_00009210 [Camellia sinensis var. sinensis]
MLVAHICWNFCFLILKILKPEKKSEKRKPLQLVSFQQSSIPLLFDTVQQFLHIREEGNCKFLLAFVSRAKVMDAMVISEANEDMSLGSWFIGLEVEHIGDRNMCCGTPPEKNSHLTIPGFSSEERKNQQNHMAFGIDMWIFHFLYGG